MVTAARGSDQRIEVRPAMLRGGRQQGRDDLPRGCAEGAGACLASRGAAFAMDAECASLRRRCVVSPTAWLAGSVRDAGCTRW